MSAKKYVVFDDGGLKALVNQTKANKTTAADNTAAVDGLTTDLQEMSTQITDVLGEVETCLNELDTVKADTATVTEELEKKVDKVSGKGLSTNDYTTAEKTKLSGIATGANKYTHPSTHPASMIEGLATVATSGKYSDLIGTPTSLPNAGALTFTGAVNATYDGSSAKTVNIPVASVNGKTGEVSLSASDVNALPDTTVIPTVPTKISAFTNDKGYLTSFTETDPTVPAWAKESTKPTYTASEVGALSTSVKGKAGGVAELDSNGKVPTAQLPSYVDDVLEYSAKASFPSTGEAGKIYVDTSTNKTYRWSGTAYVEISASLALGTTSSTAYRGDYGDSAYKHSQITSGNPHGVTKSHVGLGSVVNTGDSATPVSGGTTKFTTGGAYTELNKKVDKTTTVNGHALSDDVTVTKSDVGLGNVENKSSATIRGELTKANVTDALGYTPPTSDTTYSAAGSSLGLVKSGGDVTISSGVITVKDDSHNHTIANVDNLQTTLDNKADKSHGVHYIEGGGTTDTTNKVATWIGSHSDISEYYAGLMIAYKIGTAGSTTTTLNINNLGAVTVVKNATSAISTSFAVNSVILLVYTVDGTTAYWKAHDYDANTRNTVGDYRKNGTKLYFVGTTSSDSSASSSYATSYTNSNCYVGTDNCLYSNGAKVATSTEVGNVEDQLTELAKRVTALEQALASLNVGFVATEADM